MRSQLRFQIALFLAIRFVLHTGYRMLYPFLAVFARGMGVDLTAISLALTAHNGAGIFGPFLAFVADSHGRKTGMLLGMGIFALGAGIVSFLPTFPAFFAAIVMFSLGISVFLPSMQAYLGDQIPYERRGFALALTELSWSTAFIAGMPLVALLISTWGWVAPFFPLAVLMVAGLAAMAWLLPSDRPEPGSPKAGSGWLRGFRQVLSYKPALAGLTFGILMTTSNETVNLVFGIWMEESFNLKIAALGMASMVIGIAELSGEGLSGGLVDRLGKTRAVQLGLLLNCLAALLFPILGHQLVGALVALFLFYLTFEFEIVCSLPLMTEVLPSARGTLMAANVAALALGRSFGALVGAPLYQQWGIYANAVFAIALNLLGLWALSGVKVAPQPVEE
ncbi:MAG: MFS transporter [Anaerolineaceae bacterium]|nr:MFS transporter [Anaerolineaceae bacterium]